MRIHHVSLRDATILLPVYRFFLEQYIAKCLHNLQNLLLDGSSNWLDHIVSDGY